MKPDVSHVYKSKQEEKPELQFSCSTNRLETRLPPCAVSTVQFLPNAFESAALSEQF